MPYRIMPLYNIDRPVGQGGANLPPDVMLIQAMLNELAKVRLGWAPVSPLLGTGINTPALRDWILAFQKSVAQIGASIALDGRVDPMPVFDKTGSGGTWSTMYALNYLLRKYGRAGHEHLEGSLGLQERFV